MCVLRIKVQSTFEVLICLWGKPSAVCYNLTCKFIQHPVHNQKDHNTCISVYLYLCMCVLTIKFVSLPNVPKSAKCEIFLKIHSFKNIVCSCIISSLYISPVKVHN